MEHSVELYIKLLDLKAALRRVVRNFGNNAVLSSFIKVLFIANVILAVPMEEVR